jgi:membrane protease YdiL (CAAX protease family)
MQRTGTQTPRPWTWAGLAIALAGIPLIALVHRSIAGETPSAVSAVLREASLFLLLALLVWITFRKEHENLSSLGLGQPILRSLLRAFPVVTLCGGGLAAALLMLNLLGIPFGEPVPTAREPLPLWVTFLTICRAAVVEETFYRAYAITRIEELTGNRGLAVFLSLAAFALFHYPRGLGGIIVAFFLGAVLTGLFLWKRDLLALIVGHFLMDFVPNILVPLIGGE